MVYKHFIKRGKKKFGPYYYESYRVGNKIKKRYVRREKAEEKAEEKKRLRQR